MARSYSVCMTAMKPTKPRLTETDAIRRIAKLEAVYLASVQSQSLLAMISEGAMANGTDLPARAKAADELRQFIFPFIRSVIETDGAVEDDLSEPEPLTVLQTRALAAYEKLSRFPPDNITGLTNWFKKQRRPRRPRHQSKANRKAGIRRLRWK